MTRVSPTRHVLVAAAAAWATGCAPVPEKPAPSTPPVAPADLRSQAEERLALGLRQYQQGAFDAAAKSFSAALEGGTLSKRDQSVARKHLAFIYCMQGSEGACRDEFRKALEIDPDFALSPAEVGHPIWGPVYVSVRERLHAPPPASAAAPTRGAGEPLLSEGLAKYNEGDFVGAAAALERAVDAGLPARSDQLNALKHAAFSYCLLSKWAQCRARFNRIYEIDPDFELTAAEAGHPSWRNTYAAARRRAQSGRKP